MPLTAEPRTRMRRAYRLHIRMLRSQARNRCVGRKLFIRSAAIAALIHKWCGNIHLRTPAEMMVKFNCAQRTGAFTSVNVAPPRVSPIADTAQLFAATPGAVRTEVHERNRRKEAGQALVLVAGALLLVLLPIMGLAIDFGFYRYQQVQLQTAADAAAIAAAGELSYSVSCQCNALQEAGQNASAANGFANDANGTIVSVNNPPQSSQDPNNGNTNFVEVVITETEPTFFAKALGVNSVTLGARAEATQSSKGGGVLVE
jgi:Flp pilus assembly protein TadG